MKIHGTYIYIHKYRAHVRVRALHRHTVCTSKRSKIILRRLREYSTPAHPWAMTYRSDDPPQLYYTYDPRYR